MTTPRGTHARRSSPARGVAIGERGVESLCEVGVYTVCAYRLVMRLVQSRRRARQIASVVGRRSSVVGRRRGVETWTSHACAPR